ncbi:MAG: ATP-binding protein [Phycisphaerales bacterium]
MTLRTKFAVLLGLLGATVATSLGLSWWGVRLMAGHAEASFAGSAGLFESLRALGASASEAAANEQTLRERLLAVEGVARVDQRLGLRGRAELSSAVESVIAAADAPAREAASSRLARLCGMLQSRLMEDAELASSASSEIAAKVAWLLGLSLGASTLTAFLGWTLLRRWVERPVADLRRAAERIGAGDFDHRVPVEAHAGRGDELHALGREVNHMASTIGRMQDDRVATERLAAVGQTVRRITHNLRNPLAGIRAVAELTRDDLPPGSDAREGQERIIASVDRFEAWLTELLDETSPIAVAPRAASARALLRAVADAHQPMARGKGVTLTVDDAAAPPDPPQESAARFDPRHLEHALVALVTNALEATPANAGGQVTIRAQRTPENHWTIHVDDTGPGLPDELLRRAFVSHFTSKPGGHGIGLAVASHVVRAHGGTLTASNREKSSERADPGGARFVLCLPLKPPLVAQASRP